MITLFDPISKRDYFIKIIKAVSIRRLYFYAEGRFEDEKFETISNIFYVESQIYDCMKRIFLKKGFILKEKLAELEAETI